MQETKKSGEILFEGRVFTIELDQIEFPGGQTASREVVRHSGGVGVLAIDEENQVILVRQYRYAAGREMLEIPAGKLEPGEDSAAAGLRELAEETGYRAGVYESLGEIIPTGAYCTERIYLYLAKELVPGETHPDEDEYVELVKMPMAELCAAIARNEVQDAKTIAAVLRYQLRERDFA